MSVFLTIKSDQRSMLREIRRIRDMPDARTVAALDAVLGTGFKAVQGNIHVVTGALKASADKSSEVKDSTDTWVGTIKVGDPAEGVDYAIYEKVRDPDQHGDHDFFRTLPALDPLFVAAIMKGLKG